VLAGSRATIARAITLVESARPEHREAAQQLLMELLSHAGGAHRVGISGVPGVGKSTFIEELGTRLTAEGHRVAVLAVDPSSTRTRGSVVLMEAAGYDVVLVETVGVGQSEVAVAAMVDTFLLLTIARTGDSLQGIKKGILEIADVIAVNKADGEHARPARAAARELSGALRMMAPTSPWWRAPVLACSGQSGTGLDDVWAAVTRHRATLDEHGELARKRATQQVEWMWSMVRERLLDRLRTDEGVRAALPDVERSVRAGTLTPTLGADTLLKTLGLA
jgi:LAO/AO transport system kinase